MLEYLLTIAAGLLYGNFGEWMIHKHVLHSKAAKTNKSFFSFHCTIHHRRLRKNFNHDHGLCA